MNSLSIVSMAVVTCEPPITDMADHVTFDLVSAPHGLLPLLVIQIGTYQCQLSVTSATLRDIGKWALDASMTTRTEA